MGRLDALSDYERLLLKSLVAGPRTFHIGRCDVPAVAAGWRLSSLNLVTIEDRAIAITNAAREALANGEGDG